MHRHSYLCIFLVLVLFLVSCAQLQRSNDLRKASALIDQTSRFCKQGRYSDAMPLAEEAVSIYQKTFGPEHPHVAASLLWLAKPKKALGYFNELELLYKKALRISERVYGSEHHHVAICLNELALLYMKLGDYAKVEPLLKRSLAIYQKEFGPDHPNVAITLNNLALYYEDLGDYAKAEPLYKSALAIEEKAFGPEHPSVAISLNNLATHYLQTREYDKSLRLFKRVLEIKKKAFGPEHPSVAISLGNLSHYYSIIKDYSTAEQLEKRALAIEEKTFGLEHPSVANTLNNLALDYANRGDYAKAEPLYKRALAIAEKAFGPEHPHVGSTLSNLAFLYEFMGDFKNSYSLFKRAQKIDSYLIDKVMGFTSEDQKIKFLSKKKLDLDLFLSFITQHLKQNTFAKIDALDIWLNRKGVILEAQKSFQEALIDSDDPKVVKTFNELARIRALISELIFSGPKKENFDSYKRRISYLKKQKDRLETKLSRLSQAFTLKQKIAKADCEKVAAALPKNSVLLEFARITMLDSKAKRFKPAHYLAFVLYAGKGDKVGLFDLGNAEAIDKDVAKLKQEISSITSIKVAGSLKSSRKIYNMVFEPFKKELENVKEIFISPDGNLNLIPFEVLRQPNGKYLIEDYTFNYLAAGRDVLGFGQIQGKGKKALIMGDPDFDMGAEEKNSTLSKLALRKVKQKGIAKRSSEMRDFNFTRIPGTREEVKAIQALLGEEKAELYTGKEALEEVLRQSGTPSILHLATHGFFLSDLELSDFGHDAIGRGIQVVMSPKAKIKKGKIENPLLRSGIALAGANNALKSGDAEKSDGIVTAEKILGLRLRGTAMVVLSACETGLGEVKTGEGVFGLRRAFTQAGAKSLVMSMWAVPDKETKELMVEFYKNILSGKMNRCQALRQAALKEMTIVKERYGHANPFFWGAFVFMGEP